jgi:hypothetical protein
MGCCIGGYSDVLSLDIVPSESFTRHELPAVIGTPLVEEQMEKKLANVQEVRCIHWWRQGFYLDIDLLDRISVDFE